jgi:hypothetical protein
MSTLSYSCSWFVALHKTVFLIKFSLLNYWISKPSPTQLTQYLELWDIIQAVNLAPEQPDSIIWTLTTDSTYSASSAYKAQFFGGQARFLATKIWAAHAEPKCKLFGWLALHGKLLTADMLAIMGWPHEPLCPLCLHVPETANHLCKDCPFTIAIWNRMKT